MNRPNGTSDYQLANTLSLEQFPNCHPRRRGACYRLVSYQYCDATIPQTCPRIADPIISRFSPHDILLGRIMRRSAGLRQSPDEGPQTKAYGSILSHFVLAMATYLRWVGACMAASLISRLSLLSIPFFSLSLIHHGYQKGRCHARR